LRLRKTVRGKIISNAISQINLKVVKQGSKKLSEIFPEQNKASKESEIPSPSKQSDDSSIKEVKTSEEKPKTEPTKPINNNPTTQNNNLDNSSKNPEPQGEAKFQEENKK